MSNAIAHCTPYVGSIERLNPVSTFERESAPRAVGPGGIAIGDASAFAGTFEAARTRHECTLGIAAHNDDFSARRLPILTGYRFFNARNGMQFVPADPRLRPVEEYKVHFDASIENPIFDRGVVEGRDPMQRLLTEDSAAVVVRWRDGQRAGAREFLLFVTAGLFAICPAMLLELWKPRLIKPDP